jgi:hypothetical protein
VVVLVQHAKVKDHQRDNDGQEHQPKPKRLADHFVKEKIHVIPTAIGCF